MALEAAAAVASAAVATAAGMQVTSVQEASRVERTQTAQRRSGEKGGGGGVLNEESLKTWDEADSWPLQAMEDQEPELVVPRGEKHEEYVEDGSEEEQGFFRVDAGSTGDGRPPSPGERARRREEDYGEASAEREVVSRLFEESSAESF